MTVYTSISDMTGGNPVALTNVVAKTFKTHNTLISSGIATTSPEVDVLMNGGSKVQTLTMINKVDTSKYNHSSDNYDEKGEVGKITAGRYTVLRQDLNWGWGYTDLMQIVTKYNIRAGLAGAIPMFWNEVFERIAVNSARGAIASNASLTSGSATTAFSLELLIDGATDFDGDLQTIVVSKKTEAKLKKMNINAYTAAGKTDLNVANFAGYNVLVSRDIADTEALIFGNGALAFGFGATPGLIPVEYKRDADAGNGGGGEILRVRQSGVCTPQGFSYKGSVKPDLVELATAEKWELAPAFNLNEIAMRRVVFKA